MSREQFSVVGDLRLDVDRQITSNGNEPTTCKFLTQQYYES